MDNADVITFGSQKIMLKLLEFRYVVPENTTVHAAKLQQA